MKAHLATLLALPALLCGCAATGEPATEAPVPAVAASTPASTPAAAPAGAIDWADARAHLGEDATVCGPVVSTFTAERSEGRPTFINIGLDYPDPAGFTVIIFGDHVGAFPVDPGTAYAGRTICVSGLIRPHLDFVQIEAQTPDQITVQG